MVAQVTADYRASDYWKRVITKMEEKWKEEVLT
jgi:hypothetical protein